MNLYFSDYFNVSPAVIAKYGAFNISLLTDLPLFIDPFLLFNSKKAEYRQLHDEMIKYLRFLRDKSVGGGIAAGLHKSLYAFPEVRQTWLGFTASGNRGAGLGKAFASALDANLAQVFRDFGSERITKGSHLEKLCLIGAGVGNDTISDFTTNLIHGYLLEYTQAFAQKHLEPQFRKHVTVNRVRFNYETETWERSRFELPWYNGDHVLLTPHDILTKDNTWINRTDLLDDFDTIPDALPNDAQRAAVNNYFEKVLPQNPTRKEEREAAAKTIVKFPELIDAYIRQKEEHGADAESISSAKVERSLELYVQQFGRLVKLLETRTAFYERGTATYQDAYARAMFLKDVIENKGGHRLFYVKGRPVEREEDLQILYRMAWFGTTADVTREANDGRGPVDYKVSKGAADKTLVEFKLASNSQLKRNLERQTQIYEKASDTPVSIKVIIYFTDVQLERVRKILADLKVTGDRNIILIDARDDNKPSGSKA